MWVKSKRFIKKMYCHNRLYYFKYSALGYRFYMWNPPSADLYYSNDPRRIILRLIAHFVGCIGPCCIGAKFSDVSYVQQAPRICCCVTAATVPCVAPVWGSLMALFLTSVSSALPVPSCLCRIWLPQRLCLRPCRRCTRLNWSRCLIN